jgi:hypothetical protein
MKIETMTYRLVKNLGNYQSAAFEATASITNEDKDAHDAASKLEAFVREQLYPPMPEDKEQDLNQDF